MVRQGSPGFARVRQTFAPEASCFCVAQTRTTFSSAGGHSFALVLFEGSPPFAKKTRKFISGGILSLPKIIWIFKNSLAIYREQGKSLVKNEGEWLANGWRTVGERANG